MFCKNCGTQLSDGAKFCNSCGTSINGTPSTSANASPVSSKNTKKKSPIGIIAIVIIVIAAIALFSGGGGGYEKTVDNFFEGLFEADGKLFVSTFSETFIEEQIENNGYRNKAVLTERLQDNLDELAEEYVDELGKNWKYEYEIIDIAEYDDEVEITVSIDLIGKKTEESDVWILSLSKDGSKWYIDNFYSN